MKTLLSAAFLSFLIYNTGYAQTGWFIQNSFTSSNLYDCRPSATGGYYAGSDNGKIYNSTNGGYNWTLFNFNHPLQTACSYKYILGQSNNNWSAVGTNCAFGYKYETFDSVMRIASFPQPNLEAFSVLSGYYFYYSLSAAGDGGNFYIKDSEFWRKDTAATNLAGGRNINYCSGIIYVGDNGLIMKADEIGLFNSNGERIKWRKIPSGTTKNLYSVSFLGGISYMAVGQDGIILKSTDNAETWTKQTSPVNENLYSVIYGFICGANGTILRSYDDVKWYKQNSPTSEDLYSIVPYQYSEYFIMGRNGIMLRTTDGGGSLKRFFSTSTIEGFYNPSTNAMVRDTVSVTIRSSVFPYNVVTASKEKLNTSGYALFEIGPAVLNSVPYYIQMNHRNSLETWSKTTQVFINNDLGYDFNSSLTQAYGNNMKLVDTSPYRYAFYSGDVNQDGAIDASDLSNVENDAGISLSGYVNTDINGDDFVDAADLSIVENNVQLGVFVATP